jgi:hypothetical protein
MTKKLLLISLILLLTACSSAPKNPALTSFFPASNSLGTYAAADPPKIYLHDNLFDFVDGQADTYFAFNFQQLAVQSYLSSSSQILHVEIWQFADPGDAYGVYTTARSIIPAAFGNDGSTTPERRIAFWQDRYFVHVSCTNKIAQGDLEAFAKVIADALPKGGTRPALLQRLPSDGLAENETVYFHLEITIQNEIFLGAENKLGLSPQTNGLLAHYTLAGQPASLLLIEYPTVEVASAGLKALLALQQDGTLENLASVQVNGSLLGAVIGQVDPASAKMLLDQALK